MTGNAVLEAVLSRAPVIPVLVVDDPAQSVSLGRTLVAGGLPVLEVTLRTSNAFECLAAMARDVEGAIVGAGTVLNAQHLDDSAKAGAQFAVSPGVTEDLLVAASQSPVPLLPGAATASEAMRLLERGYGFQKFFPAEASGGIAALKGIGGPLPQIRFCPTGGVSPANAEAYLSLPNIVCVGGSWITPADLVKRQDWDAIEENAKQASRLAA
jgi:2-dehydro-3-deoxyphosphogluconate aldolase/(4S)-4-hydroxy-2-oxoglutarate aldolase